ncbi:hypothetical protein H072_2684 [Dactylellina haptotyla CBS 200.50]|uniref:Uncharacterized protein n=1 Tax=Dactylellina haptotyla (strain CBS 200.50) TaxID=1284197 RepID=S8AK84_DACHA|nr:hypothetical protein H072_2684 [Dactylellina haptotyla CBS 200.50]
MANEETTPPKPENQNDPNKERLAYRYDQTYRGHIPVITALNPGNFLGEALRPILFKVMDFLSEVGVDFGAVDVIAIDGLPTLHITGSSKPENFEDEIIPILREMLRVDGEYMIRYGVGAVRRGSVLSLSEYRRASRPGQSVGVQGIGWSSGTMGGFLVGKKPELQGHCFGMSCHHVLLPTKKSATAEEEEGILVPVHLKPLNMVHKALGWNFSSEVIVESPSLGDHRDTISNLKTSRRDAEQELEKLEEKFKVTKERISTTRRSFWQGLIADAQQQLKKLEVFDRKAGVVIATSGYKVDPQTRMTLDWGLVKMANNKTWKNIVTPVTRATGKWHIWAAYPDYKITDIGDPAEGDEVFKVGRSGESYGVISCIPHGINLMENGTTTSEWTIVGHKNREFAEGGDSGSWVLNTKGELVGMVFAENEDLHLAYLTPIKLILEDIKRQTGKAFAII